MVETNRRASLNFYQGAEGPTLLFQMYEEAHLSALKAIFLRLAEGEAKKTSLRAAGVVNIAEAVDDLVFVRLLDEQEPSRMVRKIRESPKGLLFEF
jgi:hypothetical protein